MTRLRVAALAVALAAACGARQGSVGAVFARQNDGGRLLVREVPAGLGAARAGLRPGDEVVAIDGRDVRAMSALDVHRALEGEVGTEVGLTVVRGETVLRLRVVRGREGSSSRSPPERKGSKVT